jgi:5'-methylthioadenosine phosphorylase
MIGIIGGSGFYFLTGKNSSINVKTPYGTVTAQKAKIHGKNVVFIPRHGKEHDIPPHRVNYRANMYAFKKLGVNAVFGIYASGIISKYKPGDLVLVGDFLGMFTPVTFFDDFKGGMKHVDVSRPYDKELQNLLLAIAKTNKIPMKKNGIIVTMAGPRFETKAEIRALKDMGANLVSMTHAYEATLLNELGMPYVAVAVGTNYACGVSKKKPSAEEVIGHMEKAKKKLIPLINNLIKEVY